MASLDSACTLARPLPLAALSCLPSWSHTPWAVVWNKDSSTVRCLGALDSCVPFAAAELPAAEEGVGLSRKPRGPWSSSPSGRLPGGGGTQGSRPVPEVESTGWTGTGTEQGLSPSLSGLSCPQLLRRPQGTQGNATWHLAYEEPTKHSCGHEPRETQAAQIWDNGRRCYSRGAGEPGPTLSLSFCDTKLAATPLCFQILKEGADCCCFRSRTAVLFPRRGELRTRFCWWHHGRKWAAGGVSKCVVPDAVVGGIVSLQNAAFTPGPQNRLHVETEGKEGARPQGGRQVGSRLTAQVSWQKDMWARTHAQGKPQEDSDKERLREPSPAQAAALRVPRLSPQPAAVGDGSLAHQSQRHLLSHAATRDM